MYGRPLALISVVLSLLLSAAPAHAGYEVLTGSYSTHDPVMMRQGNTYYLFYTGSRIPIRQSTDMHEWRSAGSVFASVPSWITTVVPKFTGSSLWAPDISYFNGKYHLYYSASTFGSNVSAIGLATNTTLDPSDPNYRWVDSGGPVIHSHATDNYNTIDPALFIDDQGETTRYWLAFGSFWSGIKLTEINPETGYPVSDPPLLYSIARNSSIEAAFIIYKDGYYYLFVSFDTCCQGVNSTYNVRVGRALSVTGPYTDRNGVSMMNSGGNRLTWNDERWKGPGHEAVFQDNDGMYWLLHHAYDAENNGRSYLRIHELFWMPDGWPTLAEQGPVDVNEALFAWWRMDEGSGSIAWDFDPNGYHGVISGASWVTDDPIRGTALAFDGIDDYVDLPDGFGDFDGLTVSLWAKPSGGHDLAGFIDLGNGAPDNNIFFGHSSTTLVFSVVNGTSNLGTVMATNTLAMNTWQHLAATINVCGDAVLYNNGVPIRTGVTSPPWNVVRTANFIGQNRWSSEGHYQGLIDDLRIYRKALEPNDVNDLFLQSLYFPSEP
jgi:arabinan endo-1,5-alpha-L-arabinosidase